MAFLLMIKNEKTEIKLLLKQQMLQFYSRQEMRKHLLQKTNGISRNTPDSVRIQKPELKSDCSQD